MSSPSPLRRSRSVLRPAHAAPSAGLAFVLSIIMLAIYSGSSCWWLTRRDFSARLIAPGLSWGILLGALVIIVAWVLTLIYVVVSKTGPHRK